MQVKQGKIHARIIYQIDEEPDFLFAVEGDKDESSLQGIEEDERVP